MRRDGEGRERQDADEYKKEEQEQEEKRRRRRVYIEVAALGPDYPVRADDRSFANIPCSTLSTSQHSLLRGREGKREREREE